MLRLRRLGVRDVLRVLGGFGFEVASMRGRHTKLVRIRTSGRREILIVPMHRHLSAGTVHAIYRQASRFAPEEDLRSGFFTEPNSNRTGTGIEGRNRP